MEGLLEILAESLKAAFVAWLQDFFKRGQLKKYWYLNSSLKSLNIKTVLAHFPRISRFLECINFIR